MRFRFGWVLISISVLLPLFSAGGAQPSDDKQIDIKADQVEYDPNTKMAYATGHVVIVKDDVRLTSDKARYNQASKDMFADGNVRFTRAGQEWICESLYYNFETKALSADRTRGAQGSWYVEAEQTKEAGTNRYDATRGYLTTCDYAEPHWKITYKRLEIYPGDRVVGHDAVMRVGPASVFYWPYFERSLKDNRMPFSVVPGVSSRFGPYLYLSYDWGLTEQITVTPHLDLRTERGIGLGLDTNYDFDRWGKGVLRGYYVNDEDPKDRQDKLFNKAAPVPDLVVNEKFEDDRYRAFWQHKTDVLDSLKLTVQAEKLSDSDVVQDYFEPEFRKHIQPDSFADLTLTGEHYTAGVLGRPNLNEFFTKTERLPQGDLSFVRTPVGHTGFYYEGENSVANLRREFSSSYIRKGLAPGSFFSTNDYNTFRGDTFHQIVYPKLLFGWLSLVPRVGGRGTYYSRTDDADNANTLRGVFDTGAEISFKLSHVYECTDDDLDIHGLRHVITPSVNYSYIARTHADPPDSLFQFDTIDAFDPLSQASPPIKRFKHRSGTTRFNPVDFPAFNAIDAIDNEDVFRVGMRNQIQTKRDGRPYDLLDLFMFSDLHLDPRKDEDTELFSAVEVRPTKWMALDVENRYSFDQARFLDLNTELRILQQDRWSFGIGTRYLHQEGHQVTADFHYSLNENWAVRVIERVDVSRGSLDEQEYTIYRDLHCWAISFSFRYRSEEVGRDEAQFWIAFSLKAFPQLHAQLGQ